MESGHFAEAERELQVAVAQHPRHLAAHEQLGKLYREHLARPLDAFAHEGRAGALRYELETARRAGAARPPAVGGEVPPATGLESRSDAENAPPFGEEVDADRVITVVSGLPRSGTSMMMQVLAAGGIQPLADTRRGPDEDNPLGYYEFQKARELGKDRSWLPEARGRAVKIVAQLLPALPDDEHYQVILMRRDLREVVASQKAMLARLERGGASIPGDELIKTFAAQLQGVRKQLAGRRNVRVLTMDYSDLLTHTEAAVERIAQFLGGSFRHAAATQAIRPELRRQKTD